MDSSVELYDGSSDLAHDLTQKVKNSATVYIRGQLPTPVAGIKLEEYNALLEAADCTSSVCMLNDRSIKVLIAMYPSAPKYVLIVLLDEPKLSENYIYKYNDGKERKIVGTPFNTAGWTSVEVARNIIEKIGPILAIKY